jgi:hypothetical protein
LIRNGDHIETRPKGKSKMAERKRPYFFCSFSSSDVRVSSSVRRSRGLRLCRP